jgi:hypothetical protein
LVSLLSFAASLPRRKLKCRGLLFDRHERPLTRRFVVYYCSALLDEDFGLEQVTGLPADYYKFRTSPLRNAALQAAFFHNGAFRHLEDAIRHHLDVFSSARNYDPVAASSISRVLRQARPPAQHQQLAYVHAVQPATCRKSTGACKSTFQRA